MIGNLGFGGGVSRLILFLGLCAWPGAGALASAERVDQLTQTALELDAKPLHGKEVFQASCARCHGTHAEGDASRAIPTLAGQRFRYIVRQLANFVGQERESPTMERVVSHKGIREPQTWIDVAAYLNGLPTPRKSVTGSGEHAALGRGIFEMQCATCHKADAHGDEEGFVPSLRNQNYPYLQLQLEQLAAGSRHNVEEDLVRFWQSLDDRDVEGVADYLSRLSGPGRVHKFMRRDGTVIN